MTLVHQFADAGDVALLEQVGGGNGALVLGDHVARTPACDGIELPFPRRERREIDVS